MQFLQTRHDARHRPNYPTRKSTSNLKAARERANLVEEGSASDALGAFSPWEGVDSADSASELDAIPSPIIASREGRQRDDNEEFVRGRSQSRKRDTDDEATFGDDDNEERGRGRGRTRERRKSREEEEQVVMNKSLLEDALRSSLATLLSLSSSPQNAFSQTPAMSHTSLTALLSPSLASPRPALTPARPSTPLRTVDNLTTATRDRSRISPFAHVLEESVQEGGEKVEDTEAWEEAGDGKSESEDPVMEFSDESDSDEEGTQLAQVGVTRSIPIPSSASHRTRIQSTSLPSESTFSSPPQPRLTTMSSVLPSSSTGSPSWSRRRPQRRRGQRRASLSPGPATLEERRRARAVVVTDTEEESVEPDKVFAELVVAAKEFMIMSPRLSSGLLGAKKEVPAEEREESMLGVREWATPLSPLASSVPTIDLSSSGADLDDLSHPNSTTQRPLSSGKSLTNEDGWLNWFRRSFTMRIWHATAIASLCIGIGFTAGAIWRAGPPISRFSNFSSF